MAKKIAISFVLLVIILEIFQLSPVCPREDICQFARYQNGTGQVGRKLRLEGKVVSLTGKRSEKTIIEVFVQDYQGFSGKIQVTLPHTRYDFQYGDHVVLEGKLKLPNPRTESVQDKHKQGPAENFSYPLYLAGRNIYSVMYYPEIIETSALSAPPLNYREEFYKSILNFRERIREAINSHLIEPDGSIINAMVIGDQGSVPQETRQNLSRVGIIHILSVSGTHITFAIAIITFVLARFTYRRFVIFFFASLGVIFYLLIAGSPNCASRSAIMGLMAFFALFKGRNSNLKTALWFSAAVLLGMDPAAVFADAGFDLSFLAVIGMAYVYPLFDRSIIWGRIGFGWKILQVFLLSVSISLTTVPLVYYYFGVVSWISPIANLVLLPLFSLLLPAGFTLAGLGVFEEVVHAHFLHDIANIFTGFTVLLIHCLLCFTDCLIDLFLEIPGSFSEGAIELGWVLLYYVALFLSVFAVRLAVKKHIFPRRLDYFESEEFLLGHARTRYDMSLYRRIRKCFRNIRGSRLLVLWFSVIGCLLLVSMSYLFLSSRSARIVMLNVGQGDAIILDWPRYHLQILIDGGPGRKVLSELGKTLPFYDRKIEMLILTHPHQDHLEGLISVLERYKTSLVFVNSLPQKFAETQHAVFLSDIFWQKLIESKTPILIAKKNQKFYFNEGNKNIANFRFLTPLFDYSKYPIINLNNTSAILAMDYPKRIIFMGDAQSNLERVLLTEESHNMQAEILKIGHHGSRFSSLDDFLETVGPCKALISVGENNLYGHPAESTIKKLKSRNVEVLRTDIDGEIDIPL